MTVTVYSLEYCPNCSLLKTALTGMHVEYKELDMAGAEGITELRVNGCWAMEAPVLQVDDEFYESGSLFQSGALNARILRECLRGHKGVSKGSYLYTKGT